MVDLAAQAHEAADAVERRMPQYRYLVSLLRELGTAANALHKIAYTNHHTHGGFCNNAAIARTALGLGHNPADSAPPSNPPAETADATRSKASERGAS